MESKFVPTTPISPSVQQKTRSFAFPIIALLAWFLAAISIVLAAFTLVLHGLNSAGPMPNVNFEPSDAVIAVLFPLAGAFIASRQPANPIGWILCGMGLSEGLAIFSEQYDVYTLLTRSHILPFGAEFSWLDGWTWIIGYGLIPLLLLLFPNGHFLSRRWRWLAWVSISTMCLAIASTAIPTWNFRGIQLLNAFNSDPSKAGIIGIYALVNDVSLAAMVVSILLAAIYLIVRLYCARGIQRQQLKWFTYAAALIALDQLVNGIYENFLIHIPLLTSIEKIIEALVTAALPLSMGIAMFRYRLYDIDVLIKRTLVYGALTGILVLLYFSGVIGLQFVFRSLIGQESQLAIVTSTLVIAILFQPLRRRIQKIIDRRFYRRQYNAEQTLQSFSASLRNEVDLEQLRVHLVKVVEETMQPTHVSLWLRKLSAKPE